MPTVALAPDKVAGRPSAVLRGCPSHLPLFDVSRGPLALDRCPDSRFLLSMVWLNRGGW